MQVKLVLTNFEFQLQAVQFEIKAGLDMRIQFAATDCEDGCSQDEAYNFRFGASNSYRLNHGGEQVAYAASTAENLVSWTEFKSYVFR